MVTQMHISTPTYSVPLKGQTRDKFFFPCWCTKLVFPSWCETRSTFPAGASQGLFFPSGALQISYFNFAMASKQNDQGCGIMKLYDCTFIS